MSHVTAATTTLLHSHRHETWALTVHFGEIDGRLECVGLDVRSFKEHQGELIPLGDHLERLSASLLREIPVASKVTAARSILGFAARRKAKQSRTPARTRRALERFDPSAVRRPAYSDDHWQEVAEVYRAAWQVAGRPTKAVRDHFHVSQSTAAKWVTTCRARELLPRTDQGRPKA